MIEGFNNDHQWRLSHSLNYSETDVQQYYLKPFTAAVRANVSAVMCAYDGANNTNPDWPHPGGPEPWGVPMCANPDMQRLLRHLRDYKLEILDTGHNGVIARSIPILIKGISQ